MAAKTRNIVQVFLVVALVAAGVRIALIWHDRTSGEGNKQEAVAPPLNREAYVVPTKLYISSLQSAQQLVGKDVWVKEGYRYSVYPYKGTAEFAHPAGLLLPLQKLKITKVATAAVPGEHNRQVLAAFQQDGKDYAVPIGVDDAGEVSIYADEMFFYEDPRTLYSFWSPSTWDAIQKHQVQKGMNEIQVAFAIGMGIPEPGSSQALKTVNYPNGGKAVSVTYNNGRAVDIKFAS
jgi:hypothetical protein